MRFTFKIPGGGFIELNLPDSDRCQRAVLEGKLLKVADAIQAFADSFAPKPE